MDSLMNKTAIISFFIFVTMFFQPGCTKKRGEDEVYSGDYREAELITITQEDGYPEIQFPKNQLIVKAADGVTREQLLEVLDEVGATLIGQIPSKGFYQLKVKATDKDTLDQIKTALKSQPEIEGVGYNPLCQQAGFDNRCPVEPDNKLNLATDSFQHSQYLTALEIVEGLRDVIPMSRVTVGLLERGYNDRTNPEFDDTLIFDVSEPDAPLDRLCIHGNAMTGLICADNDGSGVNGIASSFLQEHLIVYMARPLNESLFAYQTAIDYLTDVADIIINTWFVSLSPASEEDFSDLFDMYNDLIYGSPWSLFINAVPFENVLVTARNSLPVGILYDNTITVSAHNPDDPTTKLDGAGYGNLVEISANGIVNTTSPSGSVMLNYGPCYAAAQVASAAALLKSVGGNYLDVREVKQLLLESTFGGQLVQPSAGVLLSYSYPLADLLWEMYQNESWAPHVMDWDGDDLHDTPDQMAESLCEETNVTVDEFGEFTIDPSTPCGTNPNAFVLYTDGSIINISFRGTGDALYIGIMISTLDPFPGLFAINEPYALGEDYPLNLGIHVCTDKNLDCIPDTDPGDFQFTSTALMGTMEITSCQVSERNSQGKPTYLMVDIYFECLLDGYYQVYEPFTIKEMSSMASGWIRRAIVKPLPPLGFFDDYIDEMCSEQPEEPEETLSPGDFKILLHNSNFHDAQTDPDGGT